MGLTRRIFNQCHRIFNRGKIRSDLAQCDFHIFPHLKRDLEGTRSSGDEEARTAIASWMKRRPREFFIGGIRENSFHVGKNISNCEAITLKSKYNV